LAGTLVGALVGTLVGTLVGALVGALVTDWICNNYNEKKMRGHRILDQDHVKN